jgi:hypothetical protein
MSGLSFQQKCEERAAEFNFDAAAERQSELNSRSVIAMGAESKLSAAREISSIAPNPIANKPIPAITNGPGREDGESDESDEDGGEAHDTEALCGSGAARLGSGTSSARYTQPTGAVADEASAGTSNFGLDFRRAGGFCFI